MRLVTFAYLCLGHNYYDHTSGASNALSKTPGVSWPKIWNAPAKLRQFDTPTICNIIELFTTSTW
jgi:hypothetical protein